MLNLTIKWQQKVNQGGIVPIPVWRETGMGFYLMSGEATNKVKKIPHESRMAYYKLPMNGLAGVMKY